MRTAPDASSEWNTDPTTVTAYAPPSRKTGASAALDALLGVPQPAPTPPFADRQHWWSDRPLPETVREDASLRCLAEAVYFEARSEGIRGQEAVAQVVLNRVKNPAYPDEVCAVVYQNRTAYKRCQFTFACDRIKDVVRDKAAWAIAAEVAGRYVSGATWHSDLGAITHYHAHSASPSWAKLMAPVAVIGGHRFYITKGGGWT